MSNHRPHRTVILGIAVVVLLLVGGIWWQNRADRSTRLSSGPPTGQLAPSFVLEDLTGHPLSSADFAGKVVLVNFWATWCPPCKAEMPDIEQLYREFQDRGFEVIGVDIEEKPATVRAFRDEHGLTFPLVIDPRGSVNSTYHLRGLPTSWLIDRQGILRAVWVGPLNIEKARRQIRDLLERPVSSIPPLCCRTALTLGKTTPPPASHLNLPCGTIVGKI